MSDLSRRDAVKALGLLSLGLMPAQVERASRAVAALEAMPAAAAAPPAFFTAHEWQTVRLLADYVIPRDERSGSATDAKVPEFMDFLLADKDASASSRTAMRGGLAWLDNECRSRFSKTFVQGTDAQRRQVLDDIAWPKKARPDMTHGVAFFSRFRDLTASGFFSSAMGWKDVQYLGNVALPSWNGCPPEALAKLGVSY
jgi:gluconate 2-dehydrogenase subunit 3-like protein